LAKRLPAGWEAPPKVSRECILIILQRSSPFPMVKVARCRIIGVCVELLELEAIRSGNLPADQPINPLSGVNRNYAQK
jgi:hypothetical protein